MIQHASDEIRRYDKRIQRLADQKYPQTKRMSSARGVEPITSLAFVLNLDNNPHRLRRSRDAGARLGLRPKRRDSGERSPELSITKTGDPMFRRLLVQCAQYTLGPWGRCPGEFVLVPRQGSSVLDPRALHAAPLHYRGPESQPMIRPSLGVTRAISPSLSLQRT